MQHLPFDIKVDIFRRLGQSSFTNLGPVIASGREGRDAVFTPEVLRDVNFDQFMFYGALALPSSVYRPFLLRSISSGNKQAKYIEAVRIFKQGGDFNLAFNYLNETMSTNPYACFALAMFSFCTGAWEDGFGVTSQMWDQVQTLEKAVELGEIVNGQIATMWQPPTGIYETTYEYPEAPCCVYVSCTAQDVCHECFAFWYSLRICGIC